LPKERFEDSFKKLETVVNKLESGDLSLEDSVKLFEEGMRLSRLCSERLAEVQKRVELLLKSEEGELLSQPFPFEEETQ
jgi:exodeoxyribonuclease VII small subunit